jgi:hypothetical protein
MTVPGATPNLLAVGLIPLPAATHSQMLSRTTADTFGRPIVLPATTALAWPARLARESFVRRNSSITSSTVNAERLLVSIPSANENQSDTAIAKDAEQAEQFLHRVGRQIRS